jgi:MFS family permease
MSLIYTATVLTVLLRHYGASDKVIGLISAIGITLGVWQDWLASVFPKEIRGRAMGISFFFSSAAGFAAALIAGKLINMFPGTKIYGILFIAAGFCILPFVAVYYMSDNGGGLTSGSIVSAGAAQTAGMALGNILLGKLGDKHGRRAGTIFGVVMQILALLMLIFSKGVVSCYAAYFVIGLSISASIISHTNMLFETCPHDNRLAHITVGSLMMSAGSIGFPLLSGFFAATWGLQRLFIVSLIVSLAAMLWFLVRLKEPRNILKSVSS